MINVNFRTDKTLLNELFTAMKNVENTGKVIGNDLVFQTSNKFITSATVATKPGKKGYISGNGLPVKSKQRPIRTIGKAKQTSARKNVYFNLKTGKILTIKKSFTPKMADKLGFVRITKFYEAIKRSNGSKYYIPISPAEDSKTSKKRRIPKAGSAKAGWLGARAKLNAKGEKSIKGISRKVNTTKRVKGWNPSILMMNNVNYASKTSPNSARLGLARATRAMEQQYLPKADRLITKAFNERRKTMLARTGIVIR
ncbi:MAG: hypothetical protein GY750_21000 [Lentisphaerae bacterium]|nr:hypothetical protein [Lentisphaerota bacterium]